MRPKLQKKRLGKEEKIKTGQRREKKSSAEEKEKNLREKRQSCGIAGVIVTV